jgi:CheY-like chemotaxis protein/anti-sigma regulatory factor (Ser/Thr protein kinase)
MFRLQALAKGISFFDERPPNLPHFVRTDEKRLRQILINLLSNAIKYTDRGSATLRVRLRGQVTEFEVVDTGHGIRPEDMEAIFEPFERGHMPAANAVPGTGLGLTISKLLTQVLGGEISVESVPGEGSTFRVRLLLSEVPAGKSVFLPERRITGYSGPRRRILIADDDPDHVELLNDILHPLGFMLFNARDGQACLLTAEACDPELAILDIAMPGLSGLDVAAMLRARYPALRILIVSGNFHDAPRFQQAKSDDKSVAPQDAFLAKPTDIRALLEKISTLLEISWLYDAEAVAAPVALGDPMTMIRPPQKHLADLLQLGRIGYVRGIEAKLTELAAAEPEMAEFTAYLRDLIRRFELARYMAYLENMVESEP